MLTAAQLEELRDFDTPTVCNALDVLQIRPATSGFTYPGLCLRTPDTRPMVGYAATAQVSGLGRRWRRGCSKARSTSSSAPN